MLQGGDRLSPIMQSNQIDVITVCMVKVIDTQGKFASLPKGVKAHFDCTHQILPQSPGVSIDTLPGVATRNDHRQQRTFTIKHDMCTRGVSQTALPVAMFSLTISIVELQLHPFR